MLHRACGMTLTKQAVSKSNFIPAPLALSAGSSLNLMCAENKQTWRCLYETNKSMTPERVIGQQG